MSDTPRRLTRRALLRTAFAGGAGLAAASLVACGDDEETPATATPTGAASPTATGGASPTPAPTDAGTPAPTGSMSAPRWELISAPGPSPGARRDHSLVTDGEWFYVFGGRSGSENLADLWAFDPQAGQWHGLPAGPMAVRFGQNAVYLPDTNEIVVFGGQSGSSFQDDTWSYVIEGGQWAELSSEIAPSARYGAASAVDPALGLLVSHGFTDQGRFDDTWAFSADSWSDVSGSGTRPEPRCLTRAVWDTGGKRLVMFGGQSNSSPFLGDLWALHDGEWTDITPSESPSPRNFYAMAATDPGQALLFGGRAQAGDQNDLWLLDLTSGTWSQVTAQGDTPSPRSGHDCVWLPGERAVYVFAGEDANGPTNDLWRLTVPEPLA